MTLIEGGYVGEGCGGPGTSAGDKVYFDILPMCNMYRYLVTKMKCNELHICEYVQLCRKKASLSRLLQ